ncbi:sortase [Planotetraspora thailandica]|uniref:Sortase n=1 Tax=Planotetraspora thailandica TaxID=487172 RepID=A0A8J3V9Q6_9ACTN|nr:sortase [Planotetraspora thailandica]GII56699.1 sortase [Planotetraspora thailandica]
MTVAAQTPPRASAPAAASTPPPAPRMPVGSQIARGALLTLAALLLGLSLQVLLLSGLQERAAQQSAFDAFRASLAEGVAPVGQTQDGKLLAPGTPVALIDIPSLQAHQMVVLEGTDSSVMADGPGHRRDTPLPGQEGTSVLMGRAAAYGGPFGRLDELTAGDTFSVTTGQGTSQFRVLDVRRAGDPAPAPPATGKSRLILVTATGAPYMPEGILRVDADLVSATAATPNPTIRSGSLPDAEQPMAGDTSELWQLVMWLQALAVVSIAAVWAWKRWGRLHTWVVFTPALVLVAVEVGGQVIRLLPNLL